MRSRFARVTAVSAIMSAGGFLMLSNNLGCESFAAETLLTTIDFCFIFDCQGGVLGGIVQPCEQGFGTNSPTGGNTEPPVQSGPALADCPDGFGP